MATQVKGKAASSKDVTPSNPRGIPYAPFVDKVEDYVSTRDDVEPTLRSFQEMISKYQFMEANLQRRMTGLKEKIPDIQKTLDTVRFLKLRKEETDPIETTFELNDTLYAKANIPPTEEVYIWLGANVMLSYPIDEAETLLDSKLSTAQLSLSNCEEDLDFLREQITTMEVAIARVYNWEVVQKRKDKVDEDKDSDQKKLEGEGANLTKLKISRPLQGQRTDDGLERKPAARRTGNFAYQLVNFDFGKVRERLDDMTKPPKSPNAQHTGDALKEGFAIPLTGEWATEKDLEDLLKIIDSETEVPAPPATRRLRGINDKTSNKKLASLVTGDLRRQLAAEKHEEEVEEGSNYTQNTPVLQQIDLMDDILALRKTTYDENDSLEELEPDHYMDNMGEAPDYIPAETTNLETRLGENEDWYSGKLLRRITERRLKLSKSWENISPNLLMKSLLITKVGDHELLKKTAMARSMRMPIVLMQMKIRKEEKEKGGSTELLELLPDADTWQKIINVLRSNGHSRKNLKYYLYILNCDSDQERCERFLKYNPYHKPKPIWILNFLIRRHSEITEPETLARLLNYFGELHCGMRKGDEPHTPAFRHASNRALNPVLNMTPEALNHASTLFAHHCMKLEPRLLVKLANLIAQYVQTLRVPSEQSRLLYYRQCLVFNHALQLFQPIPHLVGRRVDIPNSYLWEAQRILLDASGGLPKPLLLDRGGFRAIRSVLAGLPKNQTEKHSASLHSEIWPPYLKPGDGMDEKMDPEESWSRTIRAGMMMQEAGFPKEESDEALDILQGLAPDFTPTIQQRVAVPPNRKSNVWVASIKATRNAAEAWAKFQQPPNGGLIPGVDEYAAMFEKLIARDAEPQMDDLPGDNALNFVTHEEANLADFEKARLKPPSVHELYQKMRLSGIKPNNHCLAILVSNSESLDTAHRYLLESDTKWRHCTALLSDDPDPNSLKDLPLSLFSAYIEACTREGKVAGRQLARAIRLTAMRLGYKSTSWNIFIWRPIFKNLGQHYSSLGLSLEQQLNLALELIQRIQAHSSVPVSLFHYFGRCIQKIMRRESRRLSRDIEANDSKTPDELILLYDAEAKRSQKGCERANLAGMAEAAELPTSSEFDNQSPLFLFNLAAVQMKQLFTELVTREKEIRQAVGLNEVSALDEMLSRRDPVKATYAYNYVLSLAYVGEFQEMANVVKWLIQEWGQPNLVEETQELDHISHEADMFDTLCAFRAFAEPMLPKEEAVSIMDAMNMTEVGWVWPDDDMVEAYVNGRRQDEPHEELRKLLQWTQHQRLKRQRQTEGANLNE
ncbi:Fc.00g014440.m01.CDS01 [Cosmosporella sp. VM-42]